MSFTQLSRSSGETINWKTLNVRFPPDLWSAITPYLERREGAGLCRLGLRVALIATGEMDVESTADHLVISCVSDEDLLVMVERYRYLASVLDARYNDREAAK